jgi:Fe-coproporphyrin III synthase
VLTITRYLKASQRELATDAIVASAPARYRGGALKAPVVVWNLTNRCNQRCAHCCVSATPHVAAGELDTKTCRRVLSEMAEAGVPEVIFSGGEPMLRRDLVELVQFASDLGISAHLSSNGTLVMPRSAAKLAKAGLAYLGVSIDGPMPFNDRFRGMHGGYDRAMRGLRAGRDAGLRTGMRMTVSANNSGTVAEMLAAAEDVGATRFYVSHLVQVGRAAAQVDALPAERTRSLLWDLFDLSLACLNQGRKVSVVTGGNDSVGPLFLLWARQRLGPQAATVVQRLLQARGGNASGVGLVCVDEQGVVHPDQFWRTETLGDLNTQSFAEVLQHPMRATLAYRASLLQGRCGSCRHLSMCGGSHRERALALLGNVWGSDPACVLTDNEVLPANVTDARFGP